MKNKSGKGRAPRRSERQGVANLESEGGEKDRASFVKPT